MPAAPLVSVLVVTYQHAEEIEPCLDAALAQAADDLRIEVVVADNASTDGTLDVLRRYGERIRVVARARNDGFSHGVNDACAAAGGEFILLLNPDVVMDRGCVAALLDHLARHPETGAAAALLRNPDGSPQRFARRDVDLATAAWTFTEVGQRLDARRGGRHARRRDYADEWDRGIEEPLAVDCPAAACVLVRRELLGRQPMDPDLPLFFNDAALWRRLRRSGRAVEVVPAAGAEHGYSTSVRRVPHVRVRAEWVAATRRYLAPQLGPAGRLAVVALFAADALACAVLLAAGRAGPDTAARLRGNLGGLGLPGGPPPWLTPVRRLGPRRRRAAR